MPWWRKLNAERQGALASMGYQLGVSGLMQFKLMISALEAGDYEAAAAEALASKWAKQDTPNRAERIAKILRTGQIG